MASTLLGCPKQVQNECTHINNSDNYSPPLVGIIIDDSYADGCALRELARKLAKTLCENGGIGLDADAEQMLHDYRKRLLGEEWPKMVSSSSSAAAGGNSTSSKERLERRRGDFAQKGRAISFNGGLVAAMGAKGMEGSGNGNNVGNDGGGEAAKSKTSSSSGCSTTSSSGYSSEASTGNNRKARATAWLRHRANSVSENGWMALFRCLFGWLLPRLPTAVVASISFPHSFIYRFVVVPLANVAVKRCNELRNLASC